MSGPPPSAPGSLATPQNRQRSLYNRWAFQHIREPNPTARISRGDSPVRELPTAERDMTGIRSGTQSGELTIGELPDRTCTDGFLVLHHGQVVTEQYVNGLRPDTPQLLMSVSSRSPADRGYPLELGRELGDRYFQAQVLDYLGDVQRATGHPRTATDACHEAVAILNDLNHPDADEMRIKLGQPGVRTFAGEHGSR